MKKALITGIMGQDGYYLSDILIKKGYIVSGLDLTEVIEKNKSRLNTQIKLFGGSISDGDQIKNIFNDIKPDEVYNLASQSSVSLSFNEPKITFDLNTTGLINILEIIRKNYPNTKLFQASSGEIFGNVNGLITLDLRLNPQSPYACSKAASHLILKTYRECYKLFVVNGILFPHESPQRGENFVTRKITQGAAKIKLNLEKKLSLGNINIRRDFGYALDYANAMHLIMNQSKPEDFIIATGESHNLSEVLDIAFSYFKLNWKEHVEIDESLKRPQDLEDLRGDPTKIQKILNWKPTLNFKETIELMAKHDYELLKENK